MSWLGSIRDVATSVAEPAVDFKAHSAPRSCDVADSDHDLLRRYAREGCQGAFAELVKRHADWVYRVCRHGLRDAHLAEDAAQAVFILLSGKAASISPEAHLAGWLFQTCRYVLADLRKHHARYQRRLDAARRLAVRRFAAVCDDAAPGEAEMHAALDEAIARLREADRQAIVMHFYEGLTVQQMAPQLGIGAEAAKKRLTRALGRLRKGLAGSLSLGRHPLSMAAVLVLLHGAATHSAPVGLVAAVTKAAAAPGLSSVVAQMIAAGVKQASVHATYKLLGALAAATTPLVVAVSVSQPVNRPQPVDSAPALITVPQAEAQHATVAVPTPTRLPFKPSSILPSDVRPLNPPAEQRWLNNSTHQYAAASPAPLATARAPAEATFEPAAAGRAMPLPRQTVAQVRRTQSRAPGLRPASQDADSETAVSQSPLARKRQIADDAQQVQPAQTQGDLTAPFVVGGYPAPRDLAGLANRWPPGSPGGPFAPGARFGGPFHPMGPSDGPNGHREQPPPDVPFALLARNEAFIPGVPSRQDLVRIPPLPPQIAGAPDEWTDLRVHRLEMGMEGEPFNFGMPMGLEPPLDPFRLDAEHSFGGLGGIGDPDFHTGALPPNGLAFAPGEAWRSHEPYCHSFGGDVPRTVQIQIVPEPGSMIILLISAGLLARRRRAAK